MLKDLLGELARRARKPDTRPYFDPVELADRITQKSRDLLTRGYLDYPVFVHLETRAVCNAACSFCPYDGLERKGTVMPDDLIEKVIDDLSAIPHTVPFQIAPYKVSDPLLEPRLFDITRRIGDRLPNASISLITNGSALTQEKIDNLALIKRLSYITVSLNYVNPAEYERVMKLPFLNTIERMRMLDDAVRSGAMSCPIRVSRVSQGATSDREFLVWVNANFPRFTPLIQPQNDWIGLVESTLPVDVVPDAPCSRWFDLSITATGVVAMCCMDGDAQYPKGNVRHQHVLDIYNQPFLRDLRRTLPGRRMAGSPCDRCTYLSY